MINLILKKISVLFVFALLFVFAPVISGNSDAMAACTFTAAVTGGATAKCEQVTGTTDASCAVAGKDASRAACTGGLSLASDDQANKNAFVTTLCNVFKLATGNGGKAFAAFAIISLGIGFFTGKVSWGLMLGVAAGIAAMFGAPTIVAAISGGDAFECAASDF
jgi:type IV secretory pathway VirB2 component (pilin)